MEFQAVRSSVSAIIRMIVSVIFGFLIYYVTQGFSLLNTTVVAASTFLIFFLTQRRFIRTYTERIRQKMQLRGMTKLLNVFVDRVSTCFTMPEFVSAIRETLELPLDASAMLIRSNTWDLLYGSPASLSTDPLTISVLKKNFRELSEGFGYLDDRFSLSLRKSEARGIFIFCKGYYLFIFFRACTVIDNDAFRILYGELLIFFDRVLTVARLFQIAALSKEWRQIAETQRTFLPATLPQHPKLTMAAYFRPLVNVSGDYYDAVQVDEDHFLLVMGDVSGKGLGAALVMGIITNTIRTATNKLDLAEILGKCDSAIQEMGFEDKYTVLFLGLIDLKKRSLSYINAALPDQFLVVKTIKGATIKRLESNQGIVGLVPIDSVQVSEVELRSDDILILTTDGLTELENSEGVPLDESPEFNRILKEAGEIPIDDLVERLATLGETYTAGKALRDDITILAVKAGRLWD